MQIGTLPDGTHLLATITTDGKLVSIDVNGSIYTIAEIGEILAWLSTALSQPAEDELVSSRYPAYHMSPFDSPTIHPFQPPTSLLICRWGFGEDGTVAKSAPNPGKCWTHLFCNPILVKGYPIPRRPEIGKGLEMSLQMMAQLACARKITNISGTFVLKGFSTMVIPTRRYQDITYWHVVFNEDGSHISYSDGIVKEVLRFYPKGLSVTDVQNSRHVVGWSTNVRNFTGKILVA